VVIAILLFITPHASVVTIFRLLLLAMFTLECAELTFEFLNTRTLSYFLSMRLSRASFLTSIYLSFLALATLQILWRIVLALLSSIFHNQSFPSDTIPAALTDAAIMSVISSIFLPLVLLIRDRVFIQAVSAGIVVLGIALIRNPISSFSLSFLPMMLALLCSFAFLSVAFVILSRKDIH
jgi:hypothetical protein